MSDRSSGAGARRFGTIEQAAVEFHVSTSTIHRMIIRGDLSVQRIGRSVRIDLDSLPASGAKSAGRVTPERLP